MQTRHLRTFLAIVETGSFHAAAERMCITQAAVSMQMKRLEEQLNVELFERSVRPPRLSNSAQLVVETIREIVNLADQLTESSPIASRLSTSIQIGVIPGASFVLPDAIYALRRRFKNVQVRVTTDFTEALIAMVDAGKVDAAIVTPPQELPPSLMAEQLLTEPLVVLASNKHTGATFEELLRNNPLISMSRKAEISRLVEATLSDFKISVDPIMEIDTLETLQIMVARGLAVAILPNSSIRPHNLEKLYVVPFGSPPIQRSVALVRKPDHQRTKLLDAFHEVLLAHA